MKNRNFSIKACLITFPIHLAISVVLPFLVYGAVMSSFTGSAGGVQKQLNAIGAILWVWCTGPMLVDFVIGFSLPLHFLLTILWSAAIAYFMGWFVPWVWTK